jgi:hypothetical protein
LVERKLAEREFDVHFHAQRAEAHEIVNDLACVRAIIEQTGLQHHFFGVKADPFVRARIVVMPPDRVVVFPGKAKLKIVPGNSLVHSNRTGILRSRTPEVTEVP